MTSNIRSSISQDALASLVVFLVALPLCMGIAIASGAPPAAGLITGIIGGVVAGSLSGCPLQASGPAAGLAVLVFDLIQKHGLEMLGPIVLVAGLIQMAAGVVKVGQAFRAISPSVIYGMLAGIGVLIFGAQFHVMVDDKPKENGLQNLLSIPEAIYKGVLPIDGSSHHLAAALGLGTIILMIVWTKLAPKKLKWIPGALVGVITTTGAATLWGLPVLRVNLPDNLWTAINWVKPEMFARMMEPQFLFASLALAFVASAETLLSATAVDQMHDGPRTNYDRELISQGVGNTLCGVLGSLPMTGVIVRSATNVAAGAKTRLSTILHGVWLLLMVVSLPSVLRLVPTASLAAVLVYTGYKLVNPQNIRRLLAYGTVPVAIYAATVLTIVVKDLLTGILIGLALSIAKLLHVRTRMNVDVRNDRTRNRVDIYIDGAASFVRLPKLIDALERIPPGAEAHVHFRGLDYVDHAALDALSNWEKQRTDKGFRVVVEWDELMSMYRRKNALRQPADSEREFESSRRAS